MDKDWTQDDEALGTVSVPLLGLGSPPTQHKFELSCVRNLNPGSVTISWHRTPVVKKTEEDDESDVIDLAHYGHRVDTPRQAAGRRGHGGCGPAAKGRRPTDAHLGARVRPERQGPRFRRGRRAQGGRPVAPESLRFVPEPDPGPPRDGRAVGHAAVGYALPELRVLDVSGCKLGARVVEVLAALGGRGDAEDGVDRRPTRSSGSPWRATSWATPRGGCWPSRSPAESSRLRRVDAAWNGFTPAAGARSCWRRWRRPRPEARGWRRRRRGVRAARRAAAEQRPPPSRPRARARPRGGGRTSTATCARSRAPPRRSGRCWWEAGVGRATRAVVVRA